MNYQMVATFMGHQIVKSVPIIKKRRKKDEKKDKISIRKEECIN